MTRTSRALARIAELMPRQRLVAAVGASTDADVLFQSLQEAAAIGAEIKVDAPDPLTGALLRGAEMKREMLKAEGGVLSAQQLVRHLGITPQGVGRKRERNQVFWLEVGDGYVYPAFQVGRNGLMAGIRDVLDARRKGRRFNRRCTRIHADVPVRLAGRWPRVQRWFGEIQAVGRWLCPGGGRIAWRRFPFRVPIRWQTVGAGPNRHRALRPVKISRTAVAQGRPSRVGRDAGEAMVRRSCCGNVPASP